MQLILAMKFFGSALSDSAMPDFKPDAPYQAGLLFADSDEPIGIELLQVLDVEADGVSIDVLSRILNSGLNLTSITEAAEFFVTKGGKMIGRGVVKEIGT